MATSTAPPVRHRDLVTANKVVRLRFRIRERDSGQLLQDGDELVYLHGGYGGIFPKVEQALEGCRVGDRVELTLSPDEGYGHHDPSLVITVPLHIFGDNQPHRGESMESRLPNGRSGRFTVTEIDGDRVFMDGNHPLAGRQLSVELEVLELRDSSQAERAAGFAFDGLLD